MGGGEWYVSVCKSAGGRVESGRGKRRASVGAGSRARRALQNLDVLSLLEIVPRCLLHGALLRHSAGHSLRLAFGDGGARPRLSSLGDPV